MTRHVEALQGNFSTVTELLDAAAATHPNRLAFIDGAEQLTFDEWKRAAVGFAATLLDVGVQRGDVIALMLPSSIDYAIAYHAAMRIGAITSGINLRLGSTETRHILDALAPKLTLVEDNCTSPGGCGQILPRSAIANSAREVSARELSAARADDIVAIVWTGGTTGKPKGATFDHRNLAAVARGTAAISAAGDRRFAPVPFPHVNYMTRCWDEIQRLVTTVITPQPWKARSALDCITRDKVSVVQMVPTQWRLLLDLPECASADFSSVRLLYTGGSSVPAELVLELKQRFKCPVVVRYSSTEIGVGTGTHVDDPPEVVATTVGRPVDGVEMSLVDETSGNPVSVGSIGRIRFRSEAVMRGYWRNTGSTAQSLSSDGWCTTGDLGYVDREGNLHFAGRVGDMYLRGAYNVYPVEVENALLGHPAVAQAAVVGAPDRVLGEIGVAYVVLRRAVDRGELREWCLHRLADYKAPDRVYVVESLPLTSVGKVDKRALAGLASVNEPQQPTRGGK